MAAIMLAISSPSSESTFKISYSLPVGMSYTYKIVSDQYPVPKRVVRLHSMVKLTVLGVDAKGNRICEFKVMSDTTFDRTDVTPLYREDKRSVSAHRLFSKAGQIHFVMDIFGNINPSAEVDEDLYGAEVSTQFLEQSDLYISPGAGTSSPYVPQLLLPSIASFEWEMGVSYKDTLEVPSRTIVMPTNYGTSSSVNSVFMYDTLYKATVLDSVGVYSDTDVAYMSMTYDRRTVMGSIYRSEASIIRSLRSGLIHNISENCFRVRGDDRQISYSALAHLESSEKLTSEQLRSASSKTGTKSKP